MLSTSAAQLWSLPVELGELPGCDFQVSPDVLVRDIVGYFKKLPNLPGVLIMRDGTLLGMLTREKCFEHLGRPYGVELFMGRSILDFYSRVGERPLILPSGLRIDDAVQMTLDRGQKELYQPVVVFGKVAHYNIVDMHTILSAQSKLLAQSNRIIKKQFEISQSLSTSLDLKEVVRMILTHVSELILYQWAVLLLVEPSGLRVAASQGFPPETDMQELLNQCHEADLCSLLVDGQRPVVIPNLDRMDRAKPFHNADSWLSIPLFHAGTSLGILLLVRALHPVEPAASVSAGSWVVADILPAFSHGDVELLSNFQNAFSVAIRNAQLYTRVEELSERDSLTNIQNRRGFFNNARIEFDRLKNMNRALSLLMIDIDHFKQVNDLFGHNSGDGVIQAVVNECQNAIRMTDLLGRYGGEEFVAFLPETSLVEAEVVAERIRKRVEALRVETENGMVNVTVSIGLAQHVMTDDSFESLINHSDKALYHAKHRGRNRVHVWDSSQEIITKETTGLMHPLVNVHEISQPQVLLDGDTINAWVRALELRDKETEGHAQRVTHLTLALAVRAGVAPEQFEPIRLGALLHDIGKIAIPDYVLFKPGPLNPEEWEIMRKHPRIAYELLCPNPSLRDAVDIPFAHHEHWDGNGYPRGLKGEEIPLAARIFTVVDVWDALLSERCYRQPWSVEKTRAYMQQQAGKIFEPRLVDYFLEIMDARADNLWSKSRSLWENPR